MHNFINITPPPYFIFRKCKYFLAFILLLTPVLSSLALAGDSSGNSAGNSERDAVIMLDEIVVEGNRPESPESPIETLFSILTST